MSGTPRSRPRGRATRPLPRPARPRRATLARPSIRTRGIGRCETGGLRPSAGAGAGGVLSRLRGAGKETKRRPGGRGGRIWRWSCLGPDLAGVLSGGGEPLSAKRRGRGAVNWVGSSGQLRRVWPPPSPRAVYELCRSVLVRGEKLDSGSSHRSLLGVSSSRGRQMASGPSRTETSRAVGARLSSK